MTDKELIAKKLALIETYVRELRELARPEELSKDVREERFVERTLQLAIQALLDVASHIVSDEKLGEPLTNRDVIDRLARHGWLPEELGSRLGNMVGFRNILVHGYETVDLEIVKDAVANRLDDFLEFVRVVRTRLLD